MSPLWLKSKPRELLVGIASNDLSIIVNARPGEAMPVTHRIPLEVHGMQSLNALVPALLAFLAELEPVTTQLKFVVSNHFVRYVVLRPETPIRTLDGFRNLAAFKFEALFGAPAKDWSVVVHPDPNSATTLAAGMPSTWIDLLRAQLPSWASITAVRPLWMSFFNETCSHIGHKSGYAMTIEPARITLARLDQGEWVWITTRALNLDTPDAIAKLIRDEAGPTVDPFSRPLWYAEVSGNHPVSASLGQPIMRIHPAGYAGSTELAAWGAIR